MYLKIIYEGHVCRHHKSFEFDILILHREDGFNLFKHMDYLNTYIEGILSFI